jgi:hypothetical protein
MREHAQPVRLRAAAGCDQHRRCEGKGWFVGGPDERGGVVWRVLKLDGYLVVFLNWLSLRIMLKACADSRMPAMSLAVWDRHGSQTASEAVAELRSIR